MKIFSRSALMLCMVHLFRGVVSSTESSSSAFLEHGTMDDNDPSLSMNGQRRLGTPKLNFKGDNPGGMLNECEGDCDSDADCLGNLVCLQRDENSPATVPGCSGSSPSKTDFCVKKSNIGRATTSAASASSASPGSPASSSKGFALKMYWQSSYRWQESSVEKKWCVYCHGGSCKSGDMTYIIDCANLSQVQTFDFVPIKNDDFLIKVSGTNLCYSRVDNRDLKLFPCNSANPRQLWFAKSGSFSGNKFEISQRAKSMNCITQRHHPKHNEVLLMEDCELARSSDTSYWVRYPVNKPKATAHPTPPPTARPTVPQTPLPSTKPTDAPTNHPSLHPSTSPTIEAAAMEYPSIATSSVTTMLANPTEDRNVCPDDLELANVIGSVSYDKDAPIVIMEQGTTFVRFQVKNVWKDRAISKVYTQIRALPYGDLECYENDIIDISSETEALTFTAHCMRRAPVTVVNVWISDPTLDWTEDLAKVPKCCYPEAELPSAKYTFIIECSSKCPPDTY